MLKTLKINSLLISLFLTVTLFLGSCNQAPIVQGDVPATSPTTTEVESVSPAEAAIAQEETVKGGSLNSFFPNNEEGYERVFVQEKSGFSQAKLKQGGEELGLLSINDLSNNPKALGKFEKSSETLGKYPLVTVGSTQTAVLVGDRYQVKVKSNSDDLTPDDRKVWLQKFDLAGLENLQ